jgi:hypothetical protein
MYPNNKRGPKKGSGKKQARYNVRVSADFTNKLAFIQSHRMSPHKGLKTGDIVSALVNDHVLLMEVMYGILYKSDNDYKIKPLT